MLYTDSAFAPNPIGSSGYQVQLFVGYGTTGQDTAAASNFGFQSGSGRFFIQSPQFAVTGLRFVGKTFLERPTGAGRQLTSDYIGFDNKAKLTCFLSGDLNGETGLALSNIKRLQVYTGEKQSFSADVIDEIGLIKTDNVNLNRFSNEVTIEITNQDISNRTEEMLAYQVVPRDFLNYGLQGVGATGVMFGGFESFPVISGVESTISRKSINDIRFTNAVGAVEIQPTGHTCTILVDSGICLDFDADFRIRTTGAVTITGISGAIITGNNLTVSNANTTTSKNSITFTNLNLSKFNIGSLIDSTSNLQNIRASFLVTLN